MSEVTLREGTTRDAAAVSELCLGMIPGDYVPRGWERWTRDERSVNVVAEAGGRIVGCLHAEALSPTEIFSQALRVAMDHRRRGLGLRLMRFQNGLAHGRGYEIVRGTTGLRNRGALRLFDVLGMRRARTVDRRRHPRWRGVSELPARPTNETGLELLSAHRLLASRTALAHFKRFYFSPTADWVAGATLVTRSDRTVAAFDVTPEEGGLWMHAVAGEPDDVRGLLHDLQPGTVDGGEAFLDELLTEAGFEEPGPDDRYVILEGPSGESR